MSISLTSAAHVNIVVLHPEACSPGVQLEGGQSEPIQFQHAAAESTNLPDGSQDLVSACLLFHELPQSAAQDIVREAFRVLKPGGVLSIMVSTACK